MIKNAIYPGIRAHFMRSTPKYNPLVNDKKVNFLKNTLIPAKSFFLILFLFIAQGLVAQLPAQTNTWTGTTNINWGTATNWSLNRVPLNTDDVVIPDNASGNNDNPTVNVTAACATLTMETGGATRTLTISGTNSLSVSGAVTINAPSSNNRNKTIAVGNGTFSCASVTMATTTNDNIDCIISILTGTLNVSGNIIMSGTAARNQITYTGAGKLNLGGSISGGDLVSAVGSIVNYNGTSPQTVALNGDYVYTNLHINNTAGATLQAAITATNVTGNIRVQTGTLNNGGFAIAGSVGDLFEVTDGSALVLAGTNAMAAGFGTITLGNTSTVTYSGANQAVAGGTYGNLILSGSGNKTAAAALMVNGSTTISGVTLASGGFNSSLGALSMSSNSTISLGASLHTLTLASSSAKSWTGTLTITGWTLGTNHIQVSAGGLSDTQLGQISFSGYSAGTVISALGELLPRRNWQAKFISMNTGALNWCSGETRTISVTVKNIGLSTWTDAGVDDINIGVKWDAEADYYVRANAGGLAPGATATYYLTMTAPSGSTSNHLTFDVVNEMKFWFANNENGGGPGNTVFTSLAVTVYLPPVALSATNQTTTGFTANWNASTGASGYRLDVSTDNFASYIPGYQDRDVLDVITYPVTGLTSGLTYYYRLRAYNTASSCATDNSNTISVYTQTPVSGDYRSAGSGPWSTLGTWERFNGTAWATPNAGQGVPTAASGVITIRSGHIITLGAAAGGDQMIVDGQLTVNSGITFTVANGTGTDLTVNGIILNAGTITMTGTAVYTAVSTYKHNYTTSPGTIPPATWNTGSTCEIVGYTTIAAAPAGLSQAFYNFKWNCPNQTASVNLAGGLTTVNGDLNIASTGANYNNILLILTNTTNLSLTVGGDVKIGLATLNFSDGAATTKILNIGGNYTQNIGSFTNSNSNVLNVNFTGAGKSFTQSSGAFTTTYINWKINSGASLTLNNDLSVATGRTCTVDGILTPGAAVFVSGAGTLTGTGTVQVTRTAATADFLSQYTIANKTLSNLTVAYTVPTGSQVVSALAYGNLKLDNSSGSNTTGGNITVNGTLTTTVGGVLNMGADQLSGTLSAIANNGTIQTQNTSATPIVSGKTWGGTVIFNGSSAQTIPASAFTNLTLNNASGASIAGNVTVSGILTNSAGTGGLIIKSDAAGSGSLIHSTPGVQATIGRYVRGGWSTWDAGWHMISSPVASQAIAGFITTGANNGYDLYGWDEIRNLWINYKDAGFPTWNNSANLNAGQGYLVSYQATQSGLAFTGNINTADITKSNLSLSGGSNSTWHLLGNPFSSALKWNDGNWVLNNVAGTAKIWSETGKSYTDIGANGIIPMAQGFMVSVSSSTNNIRIPAASRVHDATAWYKSGETYNDKILLVASDKNGSSFQESTVRVNEMASEGFDFEHDSRFLAGYAPQFYSVCGTEMLSTNCLQALGGEQTIPFGFVKNTASDFKIELKETIPGITVYLNDKKTNTLQNLADNPVYNFKSNDGDDANRFELQFLDVTSVPDQNPMESFGVTQENGTIHITTDQVYNSEIWVTNMLGQVVLRSNTNGNAQTSINASRLQNGVYLICLIGKGKIASRKVMVNW